MVLPERGRLSWQAIEQEANREWEAAYGKTGLHWDQAKEAYQYGWEAAQRPELAGLDWEMVESDLAGHWFRPQLATEEFSWDYIKVAVRAGWQKARQQNQGRKA
ncbi:MAG: hypothetical protein HYX94_11420 [Chloroflexi bacterium]|nr:hypothetical protein [Chloroflexota bacterium]